jgi:hypothetical protein
MNLQKILAENMLRFGSKNLSESDRKKLQTLLIESTIDKADPAYKNVLKFFNAEFDKRTNAPKTTTATFMYVATSQTDMSAANGYDIIVSQANIFDFGVIKFPVPVSFGSLVFRWNSNGSTFEGDLVQQYKLSNFESTPDAGAQQINSFWSDVPADIAKTHMELRKTTLSTSYAEIKASTNFTYIGTKLTGTAKAIYDMVSAS